jgi:uncharacterized NAD-dependent epimerase/dehydratase family protein
VDILILVQLLHYYRALSMTRDATGNIRDITPIQQLAEACREVVAIGKKPVVLILPNIRQEEEAIDIEKVIRETRRLFTEAGMPVFDDVKNALRAIASVSKYYERRRT